MFCNSGTKSPISLIYQLSCIKGDFSLNFMSQSERDVMKQVDAEILNATPEFLKLVQKYDLENQLTGSTIYDIYTTILKKQRDEKKIIPKTK